jgi:lipoprotein signal peptidase
LRWWWWGRRGGMGMEIGGVVVRIVLVMLIVMIMVMIMVREMERGFVSMGILCICGLCNIVDE